MPQLANNEKTPFTHIITLTAAELAAIGASSSKVIAKLPTGGAVELTSIYTSESFSASPAGTLSITVGAGGTAVAGTAAVPTQLKDAAPRVNATIGAAAAGTDILLVTGTSPNYATQTSGKIVIGLRISDLNGQ